MKSKDAARVAFVEAWVSMAKLFSFSPSTARVCALLILAPEPLSPVEIAEQLGVSRGNVSMCLKELRGWGVVQRVPRPGDRREFYESRGDLFEQTIAIARERKRREFDPVLGTALQALGALSAGAPHAEAERLQGIAAYLGTVDRIGREVLGNEAATLALIGIVKKSYGARAAGRAGDGERARSRAR